MGEAERHAERGDEAERLREAISIARDHADRTVERGEKLGGYEAPEWIRKALTDDAKAIHAVCDALEAALSAPTPPEQRCPTCGSPRPDWPGWPGKAVDCSDPFHADPALNQEAERRWTVWVCPECNRIIEHSEGQKGMMCGCQGWGPGHGHGVRGERIEVVRAERSREAEQRDHYAVVFDAVVDMLEAGESHASVDDAIQGALDKFEALSDAAEESG